MKFISCHIIPLPLVINNLGGGDTHTCMHAYRCCGQSNFKKPGTKAGAPGLKTWFWNKNLTNTTRRNCKQTILQCILEHNYTLWIYGCHLPTSTKGERRMREYTTWTSTSGTIKEILIVWSIFLGGHSPFV